MLLHQIRSVLHLCVLWATRGSLCESDEAMCETCRSLLVVFMYCHWEPPAAWRSVLEQESEPQIAPGEQLTGKALEKIKSIYHCPISSSPLVPYSPFLSGHLLSSPLLCYLLATVTGLSFSSLFSSHLLSPPLSAQSPERNEAVNNWFVHICMCHRIWVILTYQQNWYFFLDLTRFKQFTIISIFLRKIDFIRHLSSSSVEKKMLSIWPLRCKVSVDTCYWNKMKSLPYIPAALTVGLQNIYGW